MWKRVPFINLPSLFLDAAIYFEVTVVLYKLSGSIDTL